MRQSPWIVASISLVSACSAERAVEESESSEGSQALVYGADDRLEYEDVVGTDLQRWADSTALIAGTSRVACASGTCTLNNGTWTVGQVEDGTYLNLCTDVRYRQQDQLGGCTAFLVGPDLVATAGHCVDEATACTDKVYVFGYNNDAALNAPGSVPQSNVYSCAEIIEWHDDTPNGDWALIRLDRSVEGRIPFNVFGTPDEGDGLAILGHPHGIPMKISPTGEIREVSDTVAKLRHNVESFPGNSGSPVVNVEDGSIAAIHTNPPASHYTARTLPGGGTCAATRVCSIDGCDTGFSRATRIAMLSHLIPLTPALNSASLTGLL